MSPLDYRTENLQHSKKLLDAATKAQRRQGASDAYSEIPTLDLGDYLAGDEAARDKLAKKLQHIQEHIGFMCVLNHGVDWSKVDAAYAALEKFFALPMEEKKKLKVNELSVGYVPPKTTQYVTSIINENTKKDLNETLMTALERPDDHPFIQQGMRFVGPNQWPDIDGFRDAIVAYQKEMVKLGRSLLPLYALALDMPVDYFDDKFTDPVMWTRNAHYPPVEPEENQYGIAPHCDHSFITLLPISEVPGLQILTQTGDWIEAKYTRHGIIVNTGEFFNRWTNGRFLATPHRVVPPERDRYSMATFFNPNPDVVADPLETCVSADNPAHFEPVKLIDYVQWYIDTNYNRDTESRT